MNIISMWAIHLCIPVSGYMEYVFFFFLKKGRTADDKCASLFSEPTPIIKSFLVGISKN